MQDRKGIQTYAIFIMALEQIKYTHDRQVFGFLDVLGAYGGIQGVLMMVGQLIFNQLASFSFSVKAIQKLYRARTADQNLFRPSKNPKIQRQVNKLYHKA